MEYNFNYSIDNQILLLDIPGSNRLVFRRSELISISEDFRVIEGSTKCTITLNDGREFVYTHPMNVILDNLKPILTI